MKFKNPKIEKLYKHISDMSKEAYKDQFLISNIIFSKQELRGHIFKTYLAGEVPPKVTFFFAVKKLVFYMVKSIVSWLLSVITAVLHRFSRQKFTIEKHDELILLDNYFLIAQILDQGEFNDTDFPGLSKHLKKNKKAYVYIPKWFGSKWPFDLFRVFRILRKTQLPILTQYQVFGVVDYLKALRFLILYPLSVFRFMKKMGSSYEDRIINYALWDVFDGVVMEYYMRFLLGQHLSFQIEGRIKCFSWYENVSIDKNFYSGLRALPEKTRIIGSQLFVRPNTLMNIVPDQQEIPFKVVPDKILVNGPGYSFDLDHVDVDIGPSLRYEYLFKVDSKSAEFVLVVLPYGDDVAIYILDIILEVNWPVPVVIKFHRTMDWKKYKIKIPENFSVTNESLSLLLPRAVMVIGHSTGALVEATALGIPVIDIQCPEKFSHDFMPEIEKGVLWAKVNNAKEVEWMVKNLQLAIQENSEQLNAEGDKIRSFCFSKPTEKLINHALELD